MTAEVIRGILIPFLGTSAGAGCVFFMGGQIHPLVQRALIGFASGVMVYVVVEELIPEMSKEPHSNIGTVLFAFGFTLMLALDVILG